jgi:hypothetical protein
MHSRGDFFKLQGCYTVMWGCVCIKYICGLNRDNGRATTGHITDLIDSFKTYVNLAQDSTLDIQQDIGRLPTRWRDIL